MLFLSFCPSGTSLDRALCPVPSPQCASPTATPESLARSLHAAPGSRTGSGGALAAALLRQEPLELLADLLGGGEVRRVGQEVGAADRTREGVVLLLERLDNRGHVLGRLDL